MRERRTVYHHKGYRLRSYTELMWARLLDAADIFYLYEPHLQRVEGGAYLPDFYLPNVGVYLEVKGVDPTADEIRKADDVMGRTGTPVIFLIGRPMSDRNGLMNCGMLAKSACGWNRNICPHDLDQVYLHGMGHAPWLKLLMSVREDDMDRVRRVSEIVEEYCMETMGRPAMESHLRMTHKRVNDDRASGHREISAPERALKMFFDRQAIRAVFAKAPLMEARP
ncbi:hypothetical protein [Pseudomonas shahriarae]